MAWSWRRPAVGDDLFVKLHELDDEHGRAVGGARRGRREHRKLRRAVHPAVGALVRIGAARGRRVDDLAGGANGDGVAASDLELEVDLPTEQQVLSSAERAAERERVLVGTSVKRPYRCK